MVQPFAGGVQYEVPFAATAAQWSRDGRELFVVRDGILVSLPVEATASTFRTETPKPLFAVDPAGLGYRPSPDGKRFLVAVVADGEPAEPPVQFILNWSSLVKKPEAVQ